jgi:hypothetical protein
MKNYQQGDIVIIPYPYTDLSGSKKRPVIIVSKNNAVKEYCVVAKNLLCTEGRCPRICA